nr:putative ribonuclease H-like domain-containing protein [Tanacetum cinerariifolium]
IQVSYGLGPQKTLSLLFDVQGNPQQALKDKGVIDSGCSRHVTGNISYLSEFEEINGGYVAFSGNPKRGKITCKDTEYVVLSSDFKLPDENHVLLRVPRENNMYNVDLKNDVQENLDACKVRKETKSTQQYVLLPLWSTGSQNPQNTNADAAFDVKENENEVHVSPSSSDKIKKHDEKAKRAAKGKSLVDLSTGVRDLRDEFEEFFVNSTNRVNAASTPVTVVGLNSTNSTNSFNAASPSDNVVSPNFEIGGKSSFVDPSQYSNDPDMSTLEDIVYSDDEEDVGVEADFSNLETNIYVSPIPTTKVHKDHLVSQIIGKLTTAPQTRSMVRMVKEQGGLNQINDEDFHTCPDYPDKVYKVVKALYGLHQAPRAWYQTLANYLLENGFQRGKIDQTLFINSQKGDILFVHVYVDDIIFGSTNKELCKAFKKLMKDKFQMSSMGELTFFLGLQVKKKDDGIFISQDKYVAKILRKFGLTNGKSASTPIDTEKHLLNDPDGEDTVVATSSTEAEYIAAASCCAQVNDVTRLQDLVDKKKVVITKALISDTLRLDDAEGVKCLSNEEIFTELARMGYEKPSTKLTFYKAFFSSQWKKQVDDLSSHSTKYTSHALTQKVFDNMRRVDVNVDDVPAVGVAAEGVVSAADDVVPTTDEEPSIPSLTPPTPPPQPSHDVPSTSKGIIANINADVDVVLEDTKDVVVEKSADEEESELDELQEVVAVVTTAKIITEVVTAASDTITAASTTITAADVPVHAATTIVTLTLTATPSRRINRTEAQARKNMMLYLKNVVGFKMYYFKGMTYDDIHLIFKKHFDSNVAFLQKTKEQMDEEDSRALKRLNESKEEKAARKQSWMRRDDLGALWSFVKERFGTAKPKNFFDDFLLITLGAMFEKPDIHAQIQKNQRSVHGQAKVKS